MKLKLMLIGFLFIVAQIFGQTDENNVNLKELEIANSGALSLLDNTATIVFSNPSVKEFNINTENLSQISFDYSLIFNRKELSGLGYYGLGNDVSDFRRVITKVMRPTISGALNKNDSTTVASVGINVNLLTIFSKDKEGLSRDYLLLRGSLDEMLNLAEAIVLTENPTWKRSEQRFRDARDKLIEESKTKMPEDFSDMLKNPIITLDAAAAYSDLFPTNEVSKHQSDRFGAWSTLTFRYGSMIKAYGFVRYIRDNSVYNNALGNYSSNFEFFDSGGKLQLDYKQFSIGYEYINRNGDGNDFRSVGMVQYKINDNIYITGGFGKNFEREDGKDLLALFGIRWGFNKKDQIAWHE